MFQDSDLAAHFAHVATAAGTCSAQTGPEHLTGRLGYPEPDEGSLPLWIHHLTGPGLPAAGAPIRVQYQCADAEYAFISRVVDTDGPDLCRIAMPHAIESSERRASVRLDIGAEPGFRMALRLGSGARTPVRLCDISSGGVRFIAPPAGMGLRPGRRVQARLEVPGLAPVAAALEIRSTTTDPGGMSRVGARFTSLGVAARVHIAVLIHAHRTANA